MGQYCYCVLPQGWHSSPGIFQNIVHEILQEAKERNELSDRYVQFVDDICMGTNSLEELKIKVDKFLQVIWKSGLQVNPDKCIFGATRAKFLGFIVDQDFRSLDDKIIDKLTEKIDKIINQVINVSEDPHTWVKKLLGIYTFYRQFITRFTGNVRFLRKKLKEERPTLTPQDLEKIHDLNQRLKEGGCIAHMDEDAPTFVFTDASQHGAGVVIFQKQGDDQKLVLQESMCFKGKHGVKDPMARELIAIELAIKKMQARIKLGSHVTIFCDNKAAVDSLKRDILDVEEGISLNQRILISKYI